MPKTPLCQLDVMSLPEEMKSTIGLSEGLIQAFICHICAKDENYAQDMSPFQNARLVPGCQIRSERFSLMAQCASVIAEHDLDLNEIPEVVMEDKLLKWHPFQGQAKRNSGLDLPEVYINSWDPGPVVMPSIKEIQSPEISDLIRVHIDAKAHFDIERVDCKRAEILFDSV